MKIKSIEAICKKTKQVVIFERQDTADETVQYLGDGNAMFLISGLPKLDEDSILTIFDVPEKTREKWYVSTKTIPEAICVEDIDPTERVIEKEPISVTYMGKNLKPFQTSRGIIFIDSRYFVPLADVMDVVEVYERVTPNGAPYVAAKVGFLLQAVIMPVNIINEKFVETMQRLTGLCEKNLRKPVDPEPEEEQQCSMYNNSGGTAK